VRNPPITGLRRFTLALAVLVAIPWAGCGHSGQPAATDAASANDVKMVERMEKMRTRALNAPGGAIEASDFASQVTLLFSQGVPKRTSLAPNLVDEAVQCLDSAKEAKPEDTADLMAKKGEMLLAADRQAAALTALQESIAARPNLRAFNLLMKSYTAQKQAAEVESLCKKTLPGMKSDDSRYAVLDECLKASGAGTPEAGLRWAGSKEVSFYKARRKELEARLSKQKK
jgi:prophage DNA circulation protein